ncbi:MAG TPA: ABC transporter substrate-binding protein [Patescibacteria group bacterium]|nr:ABC transporter substrate-binding protein [Patescibacteria group bacterium]
MSQRHRTGDSDSHSTSARSGLTRRQWLRGAAGAAAGVGLGTVGGLGRRPAFAQGAPKRGGTLRVATVDKPVNMDPGFAQLYSSLQVYQNVYSKLVNVDEAGQFVPGLAKAWKQENDRTWLFDLVDNAVFHNGEPLTSKDVVYTFTRLLDPKNKLPMRIFFTPVEGVEAVGQYQVRFTLSKPFGPLLAMLSQATEVVNEKALNEKDPKLFPIGTGPYKFVEWVKDDHITLERWDKYFRPGRPYMDKIIFYAPADDTVRLTGLQTGRYNWIQTVPPQRIPELERGRDPKASAGRPYLPFYLNLNASKPPFNDKRLRQAIAWAIDRAEIVKLVYFGSHVVTAEPTPEPSPWATGVNAHKGGPDLAKAKQLMAEAGVTGGLTLTYLVKSQVPVLVKTGEILREQLKKIGITLEVQPLESGQYFEAMVGKKFDIVGGWWSVTVDPDMFYSPLQHSSSPWNFAGFKSEEADKRIEAFRFTSSPAARKKMYPEMVRWFQEEGSIIVFSNEIQKYWMKPNVQASVPYPSLELKFEETWLA